MKKPIFANRLKRRDYYTPGKSGKRQIQKLSGTGFYFIAFVIIYRMISLFKLSSNRK